MQIQLIKYFSDITSVSDYYPFGSKMYGRRWEPVKPMYRSGFNAQQKVNEIAPDHYTAMYWEYDARLGRRWNLDLKPDANWSMYSTFFDNSFKDAYLLQYKYFPNNQKELISSIEKSKSGIH